MDYTECQDCQEIVVEKHSWHCGITGDNPEICPNATIESMDNLMDKINEKAEIFKGVFN